MWNVVRNRTSCACCGKTGLPLTKVNHGDRVCRACLKAFYEQCELCQDYFPKKDQELIGGLCLICFDTVMDD